MCFNGYYVEIYKCYRRHTEQGFWMELEMSSQNVNDYWLESYGPLKNAQVDDMWKAYRLRREHSKMLTEMRDCEVEEVREHWELFFSPLV